MTSETNIIVRYAETDQMGIAHHSNYAVWFEAGRTEWLKKAGYSYSEIEAQGVLLPLYELSCRFKAPAKYEDELIICTKISEITRTRVMFSYAVLLAKTRTPIASGETKHAWTSRALKPLNAEKAIPKIFSFLLTQSENKGDILL